MDADVKDRESAGTGTTPPPATRHRLLAKVPDLTPESPAPPQAPPDPQPVAETKSAQPLPDPKPSKTNSPATGSPDNRRAVPANRPKNSWSRQAIHRLSESSASVKLIAAVGTLAVILLLAVLLGGGRETQNDPPRDTIPRSEFAQAGPTHSHSDHSHSKFDFGQARSAMARFPQNTGTKQQEPARSPGLQSNPEFQPDPGAHSQQGAQGQNPNPSGSTTPPQYGSGTVNSRLSPPVQSDNALLRQKSPDPSGVPTMMPDFSTQQPPHTPPPAPRWSYPTTQTNPSPTTPVASAQKFSNHPAVSGHAVDTPWQQRRYPTTANTGRGEIVRRVESPPYRTARTGNTFFDGVRRTDTGNRPTARLEGKIETPRYRPDYRSYR